MAIEASRLSHFLKKVVEENSCSVEVHECLAEDLSLPEKVDAIVSEWMGYCLLFENMRPRIAWHSLWKICLTTCACAIVLD